VTPYHEDGGITIPHTEEGGMSEHTPGPWGVGDGYGSQWGEVLSEYHRVKVVGRQDHGTGTLTALALNDDDARLIAAAPEMLEALENLENYAGQIPASAWELVQDAIAKARGEA
jgi:hypothetical protein